MPNANEKMTVNEVVDYREKIIELRDFVAHELNRIDMERFIKNRDFDAKLMIVHELRELNKHLKELIDASK